jgi:hypothetical protein
MASSYDNDLRLNEMATGDGSGTWGTTTNTNLELIAEAFSYGTEVITTNADTHTTTIADGATDPGRSLYLKYTGTLDSACTITIAPNDISKVWIIENGTSGSQNIIISQGSGANITIPAGDTKVVYSDGAGAGAAFFDAFASLSVVDLKVQDDLTVTDAALVTGVLTTTATQVATGGITSGSDIISDTDSTDSLGSTGVRWLKGWFDTLTAGTLTVGSGSVTDSSGAISFGDENLTTTGIVTAAGTSVFTNLDISGDIDVDGTTNLDVVDIDGAVDMASTLSVGDKVRVGAAADGTGALMTFDSASNSSALQMGNNSGGISPGGVLLYSASSNEFQIYQYTGVVGSETYGSPTFALNSIGAATFTPLSAGGHAVFNEGGIDADFRVESDTETHAFYVDGTNGNVGIGTNADYGDRLTVVPATTATTVAAAKQIQIGESSGNTSYRMQLGYYADPVSSWQSSIQSIAGGNPAGLVLNGDGGNVGIGTTEPAAKFDVRQATINVITGRFVNNTSTNAACLKVQQDGAGSSGPALLVRQDGSGNAITVDSASDGNTVFSVSNAGALSKASGSFKINHPLEAKTDTHHLIHSFIEGPQADNIYRGKVDLVAGSATANIDTVAGMTEGTFVALNREVQCFTTNESNWDAVKGSVSGNILTIESENSESTATISWLVIGERKDQHMYDTDWTDENGKVIVEPIKS